MCVCAAIAKIIGAFYRIPLTNIIGAEGMGLYQMVFPLYSVMLTLTGGGFSSAIAKTVAAFRADGNESAQRRTLGAAIGLTVVSGGICGIALILLRDVIASVQGNPAAATPYLGIAPSIALVAVSSCLRGFFQGKSRMLPVGLSQITEQLFKLFFGLAFASRFWHRGAEYGALGALLGVSLSEFAAAAQLAVHYLIYELKRRRGVKIDLKKPLPVEFAADVADAAPPISYRSLARGLYKIALPITLGSLIMPLAQAVDSVLVINLLSAGGADVTQATELFGLMSGPINSLINMPLAITLSLSVALLPKISFLRKKGESAEKAVAVAAKYMFALATPCAAAFAVFAEPITSALYGSLTPEQIEAAAMLLRAESVSVILVAAVQLCTAIMQGADIPHRPAINLLYGALAKIILSLALLPVLGIIGAAVASVVCYALTCVLDWYYARKKVKISVKFRHIAVIALSTSVFCAVSWAAMRLLVGAMRQLFAVVGGFIIGGIVYVGILLIFKTVDFKDFFR